MGVVYTLSTLTAALLERGTDLALKFFS